MQIKYKHHYVPQGYLKKWYDNKNRLWINRNNNIFTTRSNNICQEKFFYKIEILNDNELYAVMYMLLRTPDPVRTYLFYIISSLNKIAIKEDELNLLMKKFPTKNNFKHIKDELNAIKMLTSNTLEDIYASLDGVLCNYINSIINTNKDNSIIKDTPDHILLLSIIIQLYRTNKTRYHSVKIAKKLLKDYPLIKDFNWEKITLYIPIILGVETANIMVCNNYKMYIVTNKSPIPFVTSDNPVISINKKSNIGTYIYPISPDKAIIISRIGVKLDFTNINTINSINKKIIKESHEIVIFNSKNTANKYKNYIYILIPKIKVIDCYFHYCIK